MNQILPDTSDTFSESFRTEASWCLGQVLQHSDIQIEGRTLRNPHTPNTWEPARHSGKKMKRVSFSCILIHLILIFLVEDSVALLCQAFASPGQITAQQSLPKHGKARKVEAIVNALMHNHLSMTILPKSVE